MTRFPATRPLAVATSVVATVCAALAATARQSSAQMVRGVVTDDAGAAVPGVVVTLLDSSAVTVARALTDDRGAFRVLARRAGTYRLGTLRIGFRPASSEAFTLGSGEEVSRRVTVSAVPFALSAVRVSGRSACNTVGDSTASTFAVWEQARAALTATQLTAGSRSIMATTVAYERTLDASGRRVMSQTAIARSDYVTQPWRSISPDSARRVGFIVTDRDGSSTYYAPGLDVLLSDLFIEDHCFRLARSRDASRVGLAFEPTSARRNDRGVSRLRGTLWLDRASSELRTLEFRYVNASSAQEEHAGGDMEFRRMKNGTWVISRWGIRMPALEYRVRSQSLGGTDTTVAEIRVAGGELALALRGNDTLWARPPLAIAGTVFDSASGRPAPATRLTLAGTSLTGTTDPRGRFTIPGALPGQYTLEVRTPSLDSVDVAYPLPLTLTDSASGVVDVRVPSAAHVVTAFCGSRRLDAPGIVVGTVVLRGDSVPPRGVKVIAEWRQQRLRAGAAAGTPIADEQSHWLESRADARGGFRLCGVPTGTALTLRAEHDSAAMVAPTAVQIDPRGRFARADLVLDRAATRGAALTGLVLDSAGRPIADAEVALPDLPKGVRTTDRGAFRVDDIPPGSHRVTVRRLGYGPMDTTIAFRTNQTVDRRIHLTRVVALDSVSVVAAHYAIRSFEEHRKVGLGTFWTRGDLAGHEARAMSEILSQTPGLRIARGTGAYAWILSTRKPPSLDNTGVYEPERHELLQGLKPDCYARVYMDGALINPGDPAEPFNVNTLSPNLIEAMEWYASPAETPTRYNRLNSACGVLVVWTRRS